MVSLARALNYPEHAHDHAERADTGLGNIGSH